MTDINADAATLIREIERLARGGQPHAPGSTEARSIDRAVHRCAQEAELATLAAVSRKAFAVAVAELRKPLHGQFAKHAAPKTGTKTNRAATERRGSGE